MQGTVFDLKRFAVHDGNGIRTTLFFKGCPLACKWCHNPEGMSPNPQLALFLNKCSGCGACAALFNCHAITLGKHRFNRAGCTACGRCAEQCPTGALKKYGSKKTVEQLLPPLTEDKDFFKATGGGVTLSGGEPLLQADFCAELLAALQTKNIHTAVDTCGFVQTAALQKVLPFTNQFLFDVKAIDPAVHLRCTGQRNELILKNLLYLNRQGCNIEVRVPLVLGLNSGEMPKIAAFLKPLKSVKKVKLLPYHGFMQSKYLSVGQTLPLTGNPTPSKGQLQAAAELFKAQGLITEVGTLQQNGPATKQGAGEP